MFTVDLIANDIQKQVVIKKYISLNGNKNEIVN